MKYSLLLAALCISSILSGGCSKDSSDPAPKKTTEQNPQPSSNTGQETPAQQDPSNSKANSPTASSEQPSSQSKDQTAQSTQPSTSHDNQASSDSNTKETPPQSPSLGSKIGSQFAQAKDYVSKSASTAKNFVQDKLSSTKDYVGEKAGIVGGVIYSTEDSVNRRDSLNESRQNSRDVREKNLVSLRQGVLVTAPQHRTDVFTALKPADETTSLLAALVSEDNAARIEPLTYKLIDEIFNEPEIARAKIMEVQLGVRRLSQENLYNRDTAKRIAFLQATLDQRIKDDENSEVLRDGLLIAGSSVAFGTVAGFHGFDRLRDAVHETPSIGSLLKTGSNRVQQAVATAVNEVRSFSTTATSSLKSLKRLPPDQVAQRNLKALGVGEDFVHGLDLVPVLKEELRFQNFKPTNLPGFQYAISESLDGVNLLDERVILFSLPRVLGVISRHPVASRKMSMREAEEFVKRIEYKPPQLGGQEFATIVDTESGVAYPTRIPNADIEAQFDSQLAQTAHHIPLSRAEAEAQGIIPMNSGEEITAAEFTGVIPTQGAAQPEGLPAVEASASDIGQKITQAKDKVSDVAHNLAEKAKEQVNKVADGSRRAYNEAVDSVRPAIRGFDKSWAMTAGIGSAIPSYGLYYSAYDHGHKHGQDYETVYLESLVPDEHLSQISVVYDYAGQRGQ